MGKKEQVPALAIFVQGSLCVKTRIKTSDATTRRGEVTSELHV